MYCGKIGIGVRGGEQFMGAIGPVSILYYSDFFPLILIPVVFLGLERVKVFVAGR